MTHAVPLCFLQIRRSVEYDHKGEYSCPSNDGQLRLPYYQSDFRLLDHLSERLISARGSGRIFSLIAGPVSTLSGLPVSRLGLTRSHLRLCYALDYAIETARGQGRGTMIEDEELKPTDLSIRTYVLDLHYPGNLVVASGFPGQ